ncbi:hypothetical protein dsmv_3689 [Desulfococcus multivorans DSM 2059]|uniref:Uncharacterized protein n=1 Tax=Desulfococcus multivorans DSM 2059 TaxID=1121405 RepID=S7UFE0_DESML|nr:hypothetical protein dsmv_3689 [Desulfococcus multivorans DSM 2059]SKA27137.1 hypothetical protein SAMN02745446_03681 [Desulfococcus multivorans DSM 2059]
MKHIVKRAEPKDFSDWKSLANADWEPTYDELRGAPKNNASVLNVQNRM